jgi:hypothetical protein
LIRTLNAKKIERVYTSLIKVELKKQLSNLNVDNLPNSPLKTKLSLPVISMSSSVSNSPTKKTREIVEVKGALNTVQDQ